MTMIGNKPPQPAPEEPYPDIPIGFLRQRRNLLLSSILLTFTSLFVEKIDEVSLLGTKLTVTSPKMTVLVLLMIVNGYFLLRAFQYAFSYRLSVTPQVDFYQRRWFKDPSMAEVMKGVQGKVVVRRKNSKYKETDLVLEVDGWKYWPTRVLGYCQVMILRKEFTDFHLPFLAGMTAIGVGFFRIGQISCWW